MAIAAHPGDGMFTMGAAVAQHIHSGGSGAFLSLSLGERGSNKIPVGEYGEMQRSAMTKAARSLGAKTEFLTYADGEIPAGEALNFKICDAIRKYKPGIVISHWSGSWHKDHQSCSMAARDGIFYAGLKAIARELPAHSIRRLLFAENWEDSTNYHPDVLLDITSVFDTWMRACEIFPMWRGENGFRYNDYYRSLAVARGALANCRYAVGLMSDPEQRTRAVTALD